MNYQNKFHKILPWIGLDIGGTLFKATVGIEKQYFDFNVDQYDH